jgi:hypothetical protein
MKISLRYAIIILIVGVGSIGCSELEKKSQVINDIIHNKPTTEQTKQVNRAVSGNKKS